MNREEKLKELIIKKFGTVKEFSRAIHLPYTTIRSILERGVFNAKLENVILICKGLGITSEELIDQKDFVMETDFPAYNSYKQAALSTLFEDLSTPSTIEKIELPNIVMGKYAGDRDLIVTRMTESSMDNLIPVNSLIGIKRTHLTEIENEDIIIYAHPKECSVKLAYKIENKLIFKPSSNNPKYIDSVYESTDENLKILGKIVLYIVEK